MKTTIFAIPILKHILWLLSALYLKASGWKVVGHIPFNKCVIIGAPHTSNSDLFFALLTVFYVQVSIHWAGKDSLFFSPFGWFMRFLGGIPVDRSRRSSTVERMGKTIREAEGDFRLVIAPEGTRKQVEWKSGFYHIAVAAGVPIVMGVIDRSKKTLDVSKVFSPSGYGRSTIDIAEIRKHYENFSAN